MLFVRFLLAYGFAFGGIEFVYWNMKFNGSAHAINPAWRFVSQVHDVFVMSAMIGALGIATLVAIYFISERMPYCPPERERKSEIRPIDPAMLAEERRKFEDERLRLVEQQKREEELRKQTESDRQKRLEEERMKMSADDVTRSTLQDFL